MWQKESMWKKVKNIFGDENAKTLKGYREVVDKINALEPEIQALADEEFSKKTTAFQTRLEKGVALDELKNEPLQMLQKFLLRKEKMKLLANWTSVQH